MADAIPSPAAVKMAADPGREMAGVPPDRTGFAPGIAPKHTGHPMALRPNRIPNEETLGNMRVLRVELAGLEPATSWVRSRRSPN